MSKITNIIIIMLLCIVFVFGLLSNVNITINNTQVPPNAQIDTFTQSQPQTSVSVGESYSETTGTNFESHTSSEGISVGISTIVSGASSITGNSITESHSSGVFENKYPEMDITKWYKTGEKINLQNKNPIEFNFNGFSNKVEKIILNIFKDISIADANGQRKYEISVPKLDKEEVREIKSFFKLYFGTIDNLDDLMTIVNDDKTSKIVISIDVFNLMSKQRDKIFKEIDTALSQMEDGEEEYILYQISMYIKDKIKYTENHYNVNEALEDGEGVCNSYALLFKMMAERAGIITDVCLGYVEEGYHAWNRVQLKNGVYKYYDVTFYDGGKDLLYIGNAEGLHDLKAINVYLY